ncbi:MAG TPA: TRAP transporter small permease [Bacillota bacterium]
MLKKFTTGVNKVIDLFCILVQILMVLVVVLQVFYRYVLVNPLGWTEEVGIMTMIAMTFIGSYLAFRDKKHMRISLLYNKLGKKTQTSLLVIGNVLMVVMNVFIFIYGLNFVQAFLGMNSPYLGIPMSWVYGMVPVGAVLWSAKLLTDTVNLIKGKESLDQGE